MGKIQQIIYILIVITVSIEGASLIIGSAKPEDKLSFL